MIIAGVDEVGRGCLAGPVVAAAVILNNSINSLNDSKKLSKKKREVLYSKILENATSVAVGIKWNDYICLLYTSPSPRDLSTSRMPSSA